MIQKDPVKCGYRCADCVWVTNSPRHDNVILCKRKVIGVYIQSLPCPDFEKEDDSF